MKRLALTVLVSGLLLAFLASQVPAQGDGPYPVETILPPPVLWTATPPFVVYVPSAEVKR